MKTVYHENSLQLLLLVQELFLSFVRNGASLVRQTRGFKFVWKKLNTVEVNSFRHSKGP